MLIMHSFMSTTLFVADVLADDSVDITTSYLATRSIVHTQMHTARQRIIRHQSFNILQIYAFHIFMIAYYICR